MPECNTGTKWYILQLTEHHVTDLVNRTDKISDNKMEYLPFSSRLIVWIEVAKFNMAEECFDGSSRVAVGAGEDDLQTQPVYYALGLWASMVSGIVPEDDRVFLPPWPLQVQLSD